MFKLAVVEPWNILIHGCSDDQSFIPEGHWICLEELDLDDLNDTSWIPLTNKRRIELVQTYNVGPIDSYYCLATIKTNALRRFQRICRYHIRCRTEP